MTAITFDTLAYVKKLKKAGVPEKQAEAQVEALADLAKQIRSNKLLIEDDFQESAFLTKKNLLEFKSDFERNFTYALIGVMISVITLSALIAKPIGHI